MIFISSVYFGLTSEMKTQVIRINFRTVVWKILCNPNSYCRYYTVRSGIENQGDIIRWLTGGSFTDIRHECTREIENPSAFESEMLRYCCRPYYLYNLYLYTFFIYLSIICITSISQWQRTRSRARNESYSVTYSQHDITRYRENCPSSFGIHAADASQSNFLIEIHLKIFI